MLAGCFDGDWRLQSPAKRPKTAKKIVSKTFF